MTPEPIRQMWLVGNSAETFLRIEDDRGSHAWELNVGQLENLIADAYAKLSWRVANR